MVSLGSWMPDLPEHGHDGLVTARNAYAGTLGYEPIRSPSPVTAAMPVNWTGGGAFQGSSGSTVLLAGSTSALYRLTSSTATSVLEVTGNLPYHFAQFGDLVIGVHGGAPVRYSLATNLAASLGGSPPASSMIAVQSNDFVFLAGDPSNQSTVAWSGQNNAEQWTPGTNQSDKQMIPDGGPITGLAGGETVLAFQADAITVFEYIGAPLIFQRRKIARNIGALCHGGIAQHDRQCFFYSRRGFHRIVDGQVVPIGRSRVDTTFRKTYSTNEIVKNLRCSIDPERSLVVWSMPDRLWTYNWESDKWSDVFVPGLRGISTGATASVTLEDIGIAYDTLELVPGSLDDPIWQGGEPMLLFAGGDNKLYAFGGAENMAATFRLPKLEMFPGRETHVRTAVITGDMVAATVQIDCQRRMGDAATSVVSSELRGNGDVPIRASGRYLQPEIRLDTGAVWTSIQALDFEATPGGRL